MKTQYERGHFKQMLERVDELLSNLSSEHGFDSNVVDGKESSDDLEYMYYKMKYMKAKALRKTRQLLQADQLCQSLIDHVREKMQSKDEPVLGMPAVA